jgi:hypothetical protein
MKSLAVGITLILFSGKLFPFGGLETLSWWIVFSPIFVWASCVIVAILFLVVVKEKT